MKASAAKRPSVLASQEKVVQAKRNHNDPEVQEKRCLYVRVEVEDCVRVEVEDCVRVETEGFVWAFDRNRQVAIYRRYHRRGHHVGNVRLNLRLSHKEMAWAELLGRE